MAVLWRLWEGRGGLQWALRGRCGDHRQRGRRGEGSLGPASGGSARRLLGELLRGHLLPSVRMKVSHGTSQRDFRALSPLTPALSPDVGGPADPIAPTIIIPPKNTSVVAGTSEVTMECVANARWVVCPRPAPNSPSLDSSGRS